MMMVTGCVRLTDVTVSVIHTLRSYEHRENVRDGLPVRSVQPRGKTLN